jgi:hypothetical protein
LTWKEAFATLQLEAEEKIGRVRREAVEQINAEQDAGAARLRGLADAG